MGRRRFAALATVAVVGALVGVVPGLVDGPARPIGAESATAAPAPTMVAPTAAPPTTAVTLTATGSAAAPVAAAQDDTAAARLAADVAAVTAYGPREAGTTAERAATDEIIRRLAGAVGNDQVRVEDVPLPNGRTSRNVWATVGTGPITVVLGAHLDSVAGSPGADDNASGVAVLLEVARRLRAAPPRPDVTVHIAFFGAEEGLRGYSGDAHHFGSRRFSARLANAGTLPHWMASVDMVGYGARLLSVHLRGTGTDAADLLAAAGARAGAPATRDERGAISDHEAFALAGVPSAFLWRPDNPDYHGPGDVEVVPRLLVEDAAVVDAFVYLATSPLHSPRGLVHQLYVDLLGRRPDPGGVAAWAAQLRAGASPGRVGAAFLAAPESAAVVTPVARLYRAAFGRDADHGGLTYWSTTVRATGALTAAAGAFVTSAEFAARYGALDDAGFVRRLYANVLGRAPDGGGLAYWTDELASGRRDRAGVLVALSESSEHRARTEGEIRVVVAFAGLLRRGVDAGGLAYWSARPTEDLVGGVLASAEYRSRFP